MRADREKWEARYRAGERPHDAGPSALLQRWLPRLPRGRALDVAAGLGRNAVFLAQAGYEVDAIDVSPTALQEAARRARRAGVRIRWIEADLDEYRLPVAHYDLVVDTFFLRRTLFAALRATVRPGGVMVMETHLGPPGADGGPRDPGHRLRPGELRRRFAGWDVWDYEEGLFSEGGQAWMLGRIVAQRPRPRRRASPAVGLAAGVLLAGLLLVTAGARGAAEPFPVTVRDATGRTVTVAAPPRRIVSLAPSVTETLFALGLDREIVGISDADDFPPDRLDGRARVGGIVISYERAVSLQPDLVIGLPSLQREHLERLRALGLRVLAVDADSVDATLAQIRLLGRVTGRAAQAEALAAALGRRVRSVRPAFGARVYVEVWHEPLLAAAGGTLVHDLVRRSGGVNIFADRRGYVPVPAEAVVIRDPEVVFLLYGGRTALLARTGWQRVRAVRAGRVYELPAALATRPGPRIVDGLSLVAAHLGRQR